MTRDEAIEAACVLTALVYHSRRDYSRPSDGFCARCTTHLAGCSYTNDGHVFRWIRDRILEAFASTGMQPDPCTLDELNKLLDHGRSNRRERRWCPVCGGDGYLRTEPGPCPACDGSGRVRPW